MHHDAVGYPPLRPDALDECGISVVDGEFVDLDTLPTEFDAVAEQALVDSITECDIDPASLGG